MLLFKSSEVANNRKPKNSIHKNNLGGHLTNKTKGRMASGKLGSIHSAFPAACFVLRLAMPSPKPKVSVTASRF